MRKKREPKLTFKRWLRTVQYDLLVGMAQMPRRDSERTKMITGEIQRRKKVGPVPWRDRSSDLLVAILEHSKR